MLEVDKVGLTQVKGLLLQDLITLPTESEEVAVNNNVCLFAGRDGRMVANCPSYPPRKEYQVQFIYMINGAF